MQPNPRLLANLLEKPNLERTPIGVYIRGEPLPGCIPPPQERSANSEKPGLFLGSSIPLVAMGAIPGADPGGQPFGGVSRAVLPRMAPLLGLPGFAGSIPGRIGYRFSPICTDFLGRFLVISRVVFT